MSRPCCPLLPKAMAAPRTIVVVDIHQLAAVVRNRIDNVLIIDSRSFLEYNTCHVTGAANVCCSKIVKRRLQQDKVTVKELLAHSCQCDLDDNYDLVIYDQGSRDAETIPTDTFLHVLLQKLLLVFRSINLVSGGFLEFQAAYPDLCEDKTRKCTPLTSLSQPCLSISNQGPTRILPFLYLGSQNDALNKELLKDHNITYELNVSTSCPKPDHIQDAHFIRISVNDNYSEKLLPHFPRAFQFLDKVRESSANVLVHCLAGISRSPTVAIAYVMRHMRMTSDDAYRYVKSKRVTISPNFNFLGQLLEYEKQLRRDKVLDGAQEPKSAPILSHGQKRICRTDMRKSCNLTLNLPKAQPPQSGVGVLGQSAGDQSPTTALAKLSFGNEENASDEIEEESPSSMSASSQGPEWPKPFYKTRSISCAHDWVSVNEDSKVEQMEQVVPRRRCLEDIIQDRNCFLPLIVPVKCQGNKPYRISEGVVPSTLDTLPQVEEIECEQEESDQTGTESTPPAENNSKWKAVQGIPISSLKELNFTACQTSSTNSKANTRENTPEVLQEVASETEGESANYKLSKSKTNTSFTYTYKHTTKEKSFWECNTTGTTEYNSSATETTSSTLVTSTNRISSGKSNPWFGLHSPASDTQMDLKLGSKDYNRSDSASTSGLGSESSDGLDSWSECPSSTCGESEEYQAVFRSLSCLDDDRDPEEKEKISAAARSFSSQFSLTLPKEKSGIVVPTEQLKSPLSPSERHFLEDIDVEDGDDPPLNLSLNLKPKSYWKENELESSQDSGILSSPLWDVPDFKSSLPSNSSSTTTTTTNSVVLKTDSMMADLAVNLRKRKQGTLYELMSSHSVMAPNCPQLDTSSCATGASKSSDTDSINLSSSSKVSLDPQIHIPKSRDGLYRAQSCPGILCWLQRTPSSERLSPLRSGGGGAPRNLASLNEIVAPAFMRPHRRSKEHSSKFQNRYSCGSLDQYNYEKYSESLQKEGRGSTSSISNGERASLSPSHRVFRPSVDMIQVS